MNKRLIKRDSIRKTGHTTAEKLQWIRQQVAEDQKKIVKWLSSKYFPGNEDNNESNRLTQI